MGADSEIKQFSNSTIPLQINLYNVRTTAEILENTHSKNKILEPKGMTNIYQDDEVGLTGYTGSFATNVRLGQNFFWTILRRGHEFFCAEFVKGSRLFSTGLVTGL